MRLNKNDKIVLDIKSLNSDVVGVAEYKGNTILVSGALIGEKVEAKILAIKKQIAFAKIEKILIASKDRVIPPCKFFLKCGGCSFQHLSYGRELEFKKQLILDAFNSEGISLSNLPLEIISSKEYRYRNKLSLPIRKGIGHKFLVGFFRKRSHEVIDIVDCLLQTESCKNLIANLKKLMHKHKVESYDETNHTGHLRHIQVRTLGEKAVVCLAGLKPTLDKQFVVDFASSLEILYNDKFSLFYNYNPDKTNSIFSKDFSFIVGDNAPIVIDGLKMSVHPAGFFQVNDSIRKELFEYIENIVKNQNIDTIIEGYAGQGVIAAKLSPFVKNIYAVEISPESIRAGQELKEFNNIKNLNYILGDCALELNKLLKQEEKSVLILDPPRSGVYIETISAILSNPPQDIIYISCNPRTLARDVKVLLEKFDIVEVKGFDMFPKTTNIETVVVLKRKLVRIN